MVSARLFQCANMMLVFLAFTLYVVAFASTGWLTDDNYDYGFWKRCDNNHTEVTQCENLGLANQKGQPQSNDDDFNSKLGDGLAQWLHAALDWRSRRSRVRIPSGAQEKL